MRTTTSSNSLVNVKLIRLCARLADVAHLGLRRRVDRDVEVSIVEHNERVAPTAIEIRTTGCTALRKKCFPDCRGPGEGQLPNLATPRQRLDQRPATSLRSSSAHSVQLDRKAQFE